MASLCRLASGGPPQRVTGLTNVVDLAVAPNGDRLIMGTGLDVNRDGQVPIVSNARSTTGELLSLTY